MRRSRKSGIQSYHLSFAPALIKAILHKDVPAEGLFMRTVIAAIGNGGRVIVLLLLFVVPAGAVMTINPTTPSDEVYSIVESLQPGDIVEFAPGTYKYRIGFPNDGTKDKPIIIRAQDSDNPPVFDLAGKETLDWPANIWDSGRATWQLRGDWYEISGIIFRDAHLLTLEGCVACASGIRTHGVNNVTIRNCIFEYNDNGIQGSGEDILYENCIFRYNGASIDAVDPDTGHNIYLSGGKQTFRFCHIHDPIGFYNGQIKNGQNFHLRGEEFNFEYCVIENEGSYIGDMMSVSASDGGYKGVITILGSLIIQHPNPSLNWNGGKMFSLYNSPKKNNLDFTINLYYNTILGNGIASTEVVQFTDSGLKSQSAYLYNNIIYNNPYVFQFKTRSGVNAVSKNNWWSNGDYSASSQYMSDSIFGSNPGFSDPANMDYSLTSTAHARNKANLSLGDIPKYEIYFDLNGDLQYKTRTSANDLGAYEYKSGSIPGSPPAKPSNLRIE